jgi:hypothetical protein
MKARKSKLDTLAPSASKSSPLPPVRPAAAPPVAAPPNTAPSTGRKRLKHKLR